MIRKVYRRWLRDRQTRNLPRPKQVGLSQATKSTLLAVAIGATTKGD